MFNPKQDFINDIKKFNSKLSFTYEWKTRSNNDEILKKTIEEYKDKIGWYAELYKLSKIDNYAKIYEPYKDLQKKNKNISLKIKLSLENKFKVDGNNFIFEKGSHLYKGTKYFYYPKDEKHFLKDMSFGYYGDIYTSYFYARRYSGGLQVYKVTKDLKLFNVTNDKNIYMILNLIKNECKKGKTDKIFFNKTTYKDFYVAIKLKYGVGINKYFQAYTISKYTKFNDLWLYEPLTEEINKYRNNYDKSYTGWYYGADNIDRICAHGIMLLIKDKFDGISGKTGFYSPFVSITNTEIIIWNQSDVLKRRPNNKYDSMQFIKKLHFDPFKINFDINYSIKNENFRIINFYVNHQLDLSKIIKSEPQNIIIMSLNVHNFNSINIDDKPLDILQNILNICDHYNIDLCCLQEYYRNIEIKSNTYEYIKDPSHIGLVLIYKKKLPLMNINSFILPNLKYLDQFRFGLEFKLYEKKYVITHLEIGKQIFDRSGSLLFVTDLYKVIKLNYNIRINQLKRILETNPDYIIGDFNFNKLDNEYKFLTETNSYTTGLVDYTTPFGKQVDFIFAKKPYSYFTKINFKYSDHLPVIAII